MVITARAVYDDEGVLRLAAPLDALEDGQEVELQITIPPRAEGVKGSMKPLQALVAAWLADPPQIFESEAAWQEFHDFLQANRFDLPERDLGLDDR